MARKVKNERTGKTYDSIARAERECRFTILLIMHKGKQTLFMNVMAKAKKSMKNGLM